MSLSKPIYPEGTSANCQTDLQFLNNIWTNSSNEKGYLSKIAQLETLVKEREEQFRNSVNINNALRAQLRNFENGMAHGNYTLNSWIHYARNLEQEIKRKEGVIMEKDKKATRLIEIIREKNRELGSLRAKNAQLNSKTMSPYEDIAGRLEMIATIVNTNKRAVTHRTLFDERTKQIDAFIERCVKNVDWSRTSFKNSQNLSFEKYLEAKKREYYQKYSDEISLYGFLKYLEYRVWTDLVEFKICKNDEWHTDSYMDFLNFYQDEDTEEWANDVEDFDRRGVNRYEEEPFLSGGEKW